MSSLCAITSVAEATPKSRESSVSSEIRCPNYTVYASNSSSNSNSSRHSNKTNSQTSNKLSHSSNHLLTLSSMRKSSNRDLTLGYVSAPDQVHAVEQVLPPGLPGRGLEEPGQAPLTAEEEAVMPRRNLLNSR